MYKKNALVKDVINGNITHLSFYRTIVGVKIVEWQMLLDLIATDPLGQSGEKFFWGHRDGLFLVRSIYFLLINTTPLNQNMLLQKLKPPLKLKFSYGIYGEVLPSLKTT